MMKWKIGAIIGGIYGIIGSYLANILWVGIPNIIQCIFIPQIPSLFLLTGGSTYFTSEAFVINTLIWIGIGGGIGYLIDKFRTKK